MLIVMIVPDLGGLTEDEARARARAADLNLNVVREQAFPGGPQTVALQVPAPESTLRAGSWITVFLDPPRSDPNAGAFATR